jgi:hypothetical protein
MKDDAVLANNEAGYTHCDCKIKTVATRGDADLLQSDLSKERTSEDFEEWKVYRI